MDEKYDAENLVAALNYCKNLKSCAVNCRECPYYKADMFDSQEDCRTELIKDAGELLMNYLNLGEPDYIQFALTTYSSLLVELTNNRLSKTGYNLKTILSVIEEASDSSYTKEDIEDTMKHLDKESFARIRDILDCFEGMDMTNDINFHAVTLLEWALSKRALSKEELKNLLETGDATKPVT